MKNDNLPVFRFTLREDLLKYKDMFLPKRAHNTDTGWDVFAALEDNTQQMNIKAGEKVLIPLGFKTFCPEGWWFEMRPRSSTFAKKHLNCLYGVVDEGYENYVYLCAQYIPPPGAPEEIEILFGEKIAQMVPVKRQNMLTELVSEEEFTELCRNRDGSRGLGGWGSSDK